MNMRESLMPSNTKKAQKRHRCSNCDARFGYYRDEGREWVCRACGQITSDLAQTSGRRKLVDIFNDEAKAEK